MMSHLLRGRTATGKKKATEPGTAAPEPILVTEQQLWFGTAAALGAAPEPHSRHFRESVAGVLSHIPHSLPEPHQHYPPLHPSYLESSRMSRELRHL